MEIGQKERGQRKDELSTNDQWKFQSKEAPREMD